MNRISRSAVVAFSGGQDSTTCLLYALQRYEKVMAVSFDYGQRHSIELEQAQKIVERLAVPHAVLPIATFAALGDAALTNPRIEVAADATDSGNRWAEKRGLPSTFVPGRNIILLGLAAAFGLPRGADVLVTGVCEMDDAGYPDCRAEFVTALEDSIALGMDEPGFQIDAPLLHRSKAETFLLAEELGGLEIVVELSHTCYEGDRTNDFPWGRGCGLCPACETRAEGWSAFEQIRGEQAV
jgi:7-cyano-7-deazaguanine synthase